MDDHDYDDDYDDGDDGDDQSVIYRFIRGDSVA